MSLMLYVKMPKKASLDCFVFFFLFKTTLLEIKICEYSLLLVNEFTYGRKINKKVQKKVFIDQYPLFRLKLIAIVFDSIRRFRCIHSSSS